MSDLEAALRTLVRQELDKALAERPKEPIVAEYLSPSAAGAVAGVAPGTIRRWIRERRLPAHRSGRVVRVRRADLERLLAVEDRGRDKHPTLSPEALALEKFRCMKKNFG